TAAPVRSALFSPFGRPGRPGLFDEFFERGAPRLIPLIDIVLSVGVEQVESHKDERELARHLFYLMFALALGGDLKRMELAGGLVDGDGFAFDDCAPGDDGAGRRR